MARRSPPRTSASDEETPRSHTEKPGMRLGDRLGDKLAALKTKLPDAPPPPAPPPKAKKRGTDLLALSRSRAQERAAEERRLTEDPVARARSEEDLFLSEMSGTRRLDDRQKRSGRVGAPPHDPSKPSRRPSEDAEVLAELADLVAGEGLFDIADSDEYIEGIAEGLDHGLLRRLRAGDFAIQAHVDLHGLTKDEARERVVKFLLESKKAARRCVLLVHGRGLHSKDQVPVLKQAVKSWLERGQVARHVLAFATARPTDGGAGAVYVLLRR